LIGIRTIVISIFLLITSLFVVQAMYSVTVGQDFIQQSVGQSSLLLAEDMAKFIEFGVSIKIDDLIDYSKTNIVQKTLLESNQEFDNQSDIQGYIDQQEDVWVSTPDETINSFMQSLISNELAEDVRKNFVEKINLKTGHSVYAELFLTNQYGANVAQSGKTTDYRQDDEDWWQEAKTNGISIGITEYDESAKTDVIPIGVRIADNDGNFVGVMKAALSVRSIIREAEISTQYEDTTQVNIITDEGRLIYSTKAFIFNENISDHSFFDKLQSGQQRGFFVNDEESKKELVAYVRPSHLEVLGKQDWIVVIKHEIGEVGILSGMITLRENIIITSAIIVGIAIGLGIIFSRSISNPITKLTYLAKEIGKENFDVKVNLKGRGEMAQLIKNMHNMGTALKKAKKQKAEFISMITHELKSPLTPIIGFSQALSDPEILGNLTPKQLDAAETILKNANRLQSIIGDLLDSHRLDIEKMKFNFTEVDVVELINSVINNYEKELESKKIQVTVSAKPPLLLTTDKQRVEQVLTNIVINSIDFGALVTKLGGKIWVESEFGKGSTFYFTIAQKAEQMGKSE